MVRPERLGDRELVRALEERRQVLEANELELLEVLATRIERGELSPALRDLAEDLARALEARSTRPGTTRAAGKEG